jgi:hypothetical protein
MSAKSKAWQMVFAFVHVKLAPWVKPNPQPSRTVHRNRALPHATHTETWFQSQSRSRVYRCCVASGCGVTRLPLSKSAFQGCPSGIHDCAQTVMDEGFGQLDGLGLKQRAFAAANLAIDVSARILKLTQAEQTRMMQVTVKHAPSPHTQTSAQPHAAHFHWYPSYVGATPS